MQRGRRGFTLIELMLVVAIGVIITAMATVNIMSAVKNSRVNTAYQTTLMSLRQARQGAIDERCVYSVTFTAPRTIVTAKTVAGTTTTVSTVQLPFDIQFRAEPGIPNTATTTPDKFGTGTNAIDFAVDYGGAANVVYFNPDGSATDASNRINNGVLYFVRRGELSSVHAISVFGATGRIKGWKLQIGSGGSKTWIAN